MKFMPKKRRKAKKQIKRKQDNSPCRNNTLRKKYLKVLEKVCEKMKCADAYKLLRKEEKIRAFGLRAYVDKLKVDKKENYTSNDLKFFENYVNDFFTKSFMCMKENELELTNFEILVAGQFLASFDSDYKERQEFLLNAFQPMVECVGDIDEFYRALLRRYALLSNAVNIFDRQVYNIKLEAKIKMYPTPQMNFQSSLESIAPRESYYEENGNKRAVFQLGYVNNGFEMQWTFVQTKYLKGIYKGNKAFLPVCIQRHAYHRILSRLKPICNMDLIWTVNYNLRNNLKIQIYKKRILIPFYYFESKWGYFVAIINKNRLIIKTFLFLTHHYTPEGEKLEELSGLSKEEVSYWKIGSLQNFIDVDMTGNQQIKELFEKAGLGHLFSMKLDSRYENAGKDYNWDALSQYINRGKTELFDEGAEDTEENLEEGVNSLV